MRSDKAFRWKRNLCMEDQNQTMVTGRNTNKQERSISWFSI